MKPGKITHTVAALLSSITSLFVHAPVTKAEPSEVKLSKKTEKKSDESNVGVESLAFAPTRLRSAPGEGYSWKQQIVTTIFWIGEKPSENNPVPNRASSWDKEWSKSYGGFDDPNPASRRDYIPAKFTPRQNPFYCALPYNDKAATGHRPEASRVVPWFNEAYQGPAVSVCKDRWIAIRKGNKVAYAQWEDAGPFRTDHWQYVFGNERPKPNLNKGAGLDVSPAVRDYLGLNETDVTDWQFVDFKDVPRGPWSKLGENNTFVIADRNAGTRLARAKSSAVRKLHLPPSN
ncbi:MAG TPA: hypothetical protein VMO04_05095 [Chthoniobacterales bacterium]|nr:hypothetical protein [Chthoniobacterales bacterium]